jgi:pyruvate dehydrogenase E1 component alpha subunit
MVSRFAIANDIPYKLVDGNDVVAVANASKELISDIRSGKGPRLIELITYRWYGHVDWRDDVDVGVKRSTKDVENWKLRDPISRLSSAMVQKGIWNNKIEDELNNKLDKKVNEAWEKALKDPYPNQSSTLKYVYHQE